MTNAAAEAGIDMITDLVNQIIGFIPAEWGLSTVVNCCNGKEDSLERGNYRDRN